MGDGVSQVDVLIDGLGGRFRLFFGLGFGLGGGSGLFSGLLFGLLGAAGEHAQSQHQSQDQSQNLGELGIHFISSYIILYFCGMNRKISKERHGSEDP